MLEWDQAARRLTFGIDGATVMVDPTTVGGPVTAEAPYGGPARAPFRALFASAMVPAGTAGRSSGGTARFSDVFTGP